MVFSNRHSCCILTEGGQSWKEQAAGQGAGGEEAQGPKARCGQGRGLLGREAAAMSREVLAAELPRGGDGCEPPGATQPGQSW